MHTHGIVCSVRHARRPTSVARLILRRRSSALPPAVRSPPREPAPSFPLSLASPSLPTFSSPRRRLLHPSSPPSAKGTTGSSGLNRRKEDPLRERWGILAATEKIRSILSASLVPALSVPGTFSAPRGRRSTCGKVNPAASVSGDLWRGSGCSRWLESSSCGRFPSGGSSPPRRPTPFLQDIASCPLLATGGAGMCSLCLPTPTTSPCFSPQLFFSSSQKVTAFMFCAFLWGMLMVLEILVKKNCTMHVQLLRFQLRKLQSWTIKSCRMGFMRNGIMDY